MRTIIAALPIMFFVTQTLASDSERSAAMLLSMMPFDQVYFESSAREQAAQRVWEYWDHFSSRIPRISPDERAWLQREMDTTDSQRIDRLVRTEVFQLWSLESIVEACLEDTEGVLTNIGGELEMFYWVQLGTCFDQHSELNRSLEAAGLSNGRYDGAFALVTLDMVHDAILQRVAPSAMADVMGWTLD